MSFCWAACSCAARGASGGRKNTAPLTRLRHSIYSSLRRAISTKGFFLPARLTLPAFLLPGLKIGPVYWLLRSHLAVKKLLPVFCWAPLLESADGVCHESKRDAMPFFSSNRRFYVTLYKKWTKNRAGRFFHAIKVGAPLSLKTMKKHEPGDSLEESRSLRDVTA